MEWTHGLEDAILGLAGTPWILPAMYVLALFDGIFPPLPNESILTAMAVATVTGHTQYSVTVVILVGIIGAVSGDTLGWTVGRFLLPEKLSGKKGKALEAARAGLQSHWLSVLTTARFIPGWRIMVNMGCGSIRIPLRKYLPIQFMTATVWAIYHAIVGVAAGALLRDNPLIGIIVGIIVGVLLGMLIERGAKAITARMGVKTETVGPSLKDAKRAIERIEDRVEDRVEELREKREERRERKENRKDSHAQTAQVHCDNKTSKVEN